MEELENYALTETDAAKYLGVSPVTLRIMRSRGEAPGRMRPVPFIKYGSRGIRYKLSDLKAYRDSYTVEPDAKASKSPAAA